MKLMPKITSTVLATITGVVAVAQTGPISENVSQTGPTVQSCGVVEDICPKIQTAVDWASKVANDDTIGYSLGGARTGEYDCSKLVITGFEVAGIWTGATYTGNMYDTFTRNGFTPMKYQYGMDLEVGDVLLTKGHTEMYIGNGTNVGAHLDFDGKRGDSSGDEIDFGPVNEYTKNWTWVLRYAPHWYEWYTTYISEEDSFYAFVEHNDKVLSYRDGTISVERETGEEHQIWRFEKKGNNYRITNGAFEGDFCIYQTSSDSLILHEANTDNSCLTNLEGIVKSSPYDACESKQRFEIRPLTSVRVEYDFGGNSCPIFEENYGENYLGAYDLTWMSGFIGWFDEKGNKIDASSKVTNPHAHTLTARFDEEIEPTVTIETVPESTTVISVTNPQYNAPLELESTTTATTANRTTTASTTTPSTTKTTTATTKMTTTKTTTSKATTTSYKATTTTTTTIKFGDWSSWSRELPSASNLEVETRDVLIGYEMLYFCIKDARYGNRVYRDYSISDVLAEWGGSTAYGEHSFMTWNGTPTYFYSSEYIDSRPTVAPGEWLNYGQSGINAGNSTAYVVEYGPNTILAYKSHEVYETQYRYRTVNEIKG